MSKKRAAARSKSAATAPAVAPRMALPSAVRAPAIPPLAVGIALSVLLHALALAVHFTADMQPKQKAKDPPLEVVLVNARSRQKPVDPQALAQANLDGGGTTERDLRAKTPLPASRRDKAGDQLTEAQRRVQEMEAQQQKLLTELAARARLSPKERKLEQPDPAPTPLQQLSGAELAAQAMAMARLEAEIARNVEDYNKRPRKKFLGVRAQEYRFARYVDDWRLQIERIGSQNYPAAARGKLYGNVTLTVEIRHDGALASVELERSSGHKVLDDAALRIVRAAAPYPPFPTDIRRDYDIISITRTLIFVRGDLVESR